MCQLVNYIIRGHFSILGVQYFRSVAGWVVPIHAKQLFCFTLNLKDLYHDEVFFVIKVTWVAHWQIVVKPFNDSRAVFDVNACLGQKVCAKDDILLELSIKD